MSGIARPRHFGFILRSRLHSNSTTGGLEVYDINNNQLTGAAFIGTVGLDWQFAGIGPVHGAGESDLVLRNKNSGAFEVYDIANNQLTGAAPLGSVGLDWQLGGFAADPPSGSTGDSSQAAQLTQAMAGFTGSSGAGESLNTPPPRCRHVTADVSDGTAARLDTVSGDLQLDMLLQQKNAFHQCRVLSAPNFLFHSGRKKGP